MKIYYYNVHYTIKVDGYTVEYTATGLIKTESPTKVRTLVCKELIKRPNVLIDSINFEDIRDLENLLTDEKVLILTNKMLPCEW
jgi:hypothetical protein